MRFETVLNVALNDFGSDQQESYRTSLATLLGGTVSAANITLTVTSASVRVVSDVVTSGEASAQTIVSALTSQSTASLTSALGFPVVQIEAPTTYQRSAISPSPPPGCGVFDAQPPTPPPTPCPPGYEFSVGGETCQECPAGTYCVEGILRPCPPNTYSASTGAGDLSFCRSCPASTSSEIRSTSINDCICNPGSFFDATVEACEACPFHGTGTICPRAGMTVEDIILLPGYYRWRADVKDIRPCPNSARCEGNAAADSRLWEVVGRTEPTFGQELLDSALQAQLAPQLTPLGSSAGSSQGIVLRASSNSTTEIRLDNFIDVNGLYLRPVNGTKPAASLWGEAYCKRTLAGPYCQLCLDGSAAYYNADADECRECSATASSNPAMRAITLIGGAVLGGLWLLTSQACALKMVLMMSGGVKKPSRATRLLIRFSQIWLKDLEKLAAARKASGNLRELLSFMQIITNLDDVYLIRFPDSFTRLLNSMAGLVTITAPFPPLACVGVAGHIARLRLFSQTPAIVGAIIIAVYVAYGAISRRCKRARGRQKLPHTRQKQSMWRQMCATLQQTETDVLDAAPW